MDRVITFQEFTELKEWMVLHFASKQDLAELKEESTKRFGKLEQDASILKQDVSALKFDLSELRSEFKSFKQEMTEFKTETNTRFDKVFGFLEKLDQERIFTHEAILRIEENQNQDRVFMHEAILGIDKDLMFTREAIIRIEEKLSK